MTTLFLFFAATCAVLNGLPDRRCTPGDVFPGATAAQVCKPGYARSVRHVSGKTKARVYAAYGVKSHKPGEFEVDHVIPLCLGGSNSERNLFPQPYDGEWGALTKDKLEWWACREVCAGRMPLAEAQNLLRENWKAGYLRMQKEKKK